MTVLIILREAKGQPVCHHPHCCSVSASPDRHCSCLSDLCSCALFSEGPREPAGAPSCPGCTVGEGTAHLQAESLRHVQLSRFLTATCRFMLSMLQAPWMVCLSRCWTDSPNLKPPKNTLQGKNRNCSAVLISQDVDVPGRSFNLMEP